MTKGLKELKRLPNAIKDTFKDSFDIIKKELKDKEKKDKMLEIIIKKKVNVNYFIFTCAIDDWPYEDYLDEYNNPDNWFVCGPYICGPHIYDNQEKKPPLLSRKEYDFLVEELL